MALPHTKSRELIFQVLFSCHFLNDVHELDPAFFMEQLKTTHKNVIDAVKYVAKILPYKKEIDQEIAKVSTSYDITRIQGVELNILRLAIYEMKYDEAKLAPQIVIAEAIRLAKKFSTTESITFINGVLDNLYKNTSPITLQPQALLT